MTRKFTPRTMSVSLEHHMTTFLLFGEANPAHVIALREAGWAEVAARTKRHRPTKLGARSTALRLVAGVQVAAREAGHGLEDRPAA